MHHIDSLRAYAILMMLQGHFIYSLLAPVYHQPENPIFRFWMYCKGFTAPIFFTITGLVLVYLLLKNPDPSYRVRRIKKALRRGIYLLFWGYLLRINLWGLFSGILYPNFWCVDVLHCIGLALIILAFGFWITANRSFRAFQWLLITFGVAIFLLEPIYTDLQLSNWPPALRNYLNTDQGSVFTPFPWIGYTLLGGFLGTLYHQSNAGRLFGLPILGLGLAIFGYLLATFSSQVFMDIHYTFGIELLKEVAYNNYLFIRFGHILIFIATFLLLEPFLAKLKTFNRIGQQTLNIYIIHFIVLYGSWFGWGLTRWFEGVLSPLPAIFGALLFVLSISYLSLRVHAIRGFFKEIHWRNSLQSAFAVGKSCWSIALLHMRKAKAWFLEGRAYLLLLPVLLQGCSLVEPVSLRVQWLKGIKLTTRISSNSYSDFVVDEQGNAYIACFYTNIDRQDYIYLVKTSPDGTKLWEKDTNTGRATGITLAPTGEVWVTGHFQGQIVLDEHRAVAASSPSPFLAKFHPSGKCLGLFTGKGVGTGYHCHATNHGTVLLTGSSGKQLEWDQQELNRTEKTEETFIATFDSLGNCQWLRSMPGHINKVSSNANGELYLTGGFQSTFSYDSISLQTTGDFDQDAYLLKIDPNGKGLWGRQYGQEGITRNGYRTTEVGGDLNVLPSGEILLAIRTEGFEMVNPKHLGHEPKSWIKALLIDPNGKINQSITLLESELSAAILTLRTTTNYHYLTTIFPRNCKIRNVKFDFEYPKIGVVRFDHQWNIRDTLFSQNEHAGQDVLLRVSNKYGDRLYCSGHFRNFFSIDHYELSNAGNHELFLMGLSN